MKINPDNLKKQFTNKSFKIGIYSVIISLIMIAIAVFAVITADSLPAKYSKIDMTNQNLYTLSEESVNIAKAINKDINIYLIAETGKEDSRITTLMEKYASYNSRINVKYIDPKIYPHFTKTYTDEDVYDNSLIIEGNGKNRYIAAPELFEIEVEYDYYNNNQKLNLTGFDGENVITSTLSYINSEDLPTVYQTSGNGEMELSQSFKSSVEHQNIELKSINLMTAGEIPEDADAIFINVPARDITAQEKDILLSYLENGGKMLLITGPDSQMTVLNELMKNYGVQGENSLIFETDTTMTMRELGYYLSPHMYSSRITDPLKAANLRVLLPLSHPIRIYTDDTDAKVVSFLETSSKSYLKSIESLANSMEQTDTDEVGAFATGVEITKEDIGTCIYWISSPNLTVDSINADASGANEDLFLNAVNSLCEREESIAIHAKPLAQEYLAINSKYAAVWSIVFIFIVPVIFITLGILVWLKRRKG